MKSYIWRVGSKADRISDNFLESWFPPRPGFGRLRSCPYN